jgi:hypothetical protein
MQPTADAQMTHRAALLGCMLNTRGATYDDGRKAQESRVFLQDTVMGVGEGADAPWRATRLSDPW